MSLEAQTMRDTTMSALDVIESYVIDVALQLPRRQRNDVAFELRALLTEQLQDQAEASGRRSDAAMAIELLRAHGRPEDIAARYREPLTIIDAADGRTFARAAVIGLVVIWALGLIDSLQRMSAAGSGLLNALGQWWVGTVLASFWWPGVLLVYFALASWTRRRWPESRRWQPRDLTRLKGGRAALALGILAICCGLYVLIQPSWLLDIAFGGRAAPAAYDALTYTESFRHGPAPWLLTLLALNLPLLLAVMIEGRWSARLRRIESALTLLLSAAMIWALAEGPIMMTPASDSVAKLCLLGILAYVLIHLGIKLRNMVRPAPTPANSR